MKALHDRSTEILFCALLLLSPWMLKAQDVVPSMGTEFWLGYMQNYQGPYPQSLDIFISSDIATSGVASMPSGTWSQPFTVTPGVTTTVTVPNMAMHQNSGVVENKGIKIETADTVAVFAINFEQYSADGSAVYPIQSLGTEYRLFSYPGISSTLGSELLIVATEDGTEMEITTTTATIAGPPVGVPTTITLNAGQSYQLKASTTNGDLTGTTIVGTEESGSCRPFAVFSGTVCTRVPDNCTACDHIFSQNLPSTVWGTTYYSVPFDSQSAYTYRILAHEDGTVVTRNGANPVTLNAGQFIEANSVTQPICFEGNVPFCVAQYMEGASCSITGDPALLILNDASQKIDNITFSTVQSTVINNHFLNLIVDAVDAGQVYLDGALIDPNEFTSFPACPSVVHATITIPQGSHTLNCDGGLTAYIYGTGGYESYAYSVGSFTPAPPINLDSVYCGLDADGNITLSLPEPLFNPYWTTLDAPEDTLHLGPVYTFTPTGSEIYVVTGSENASGCEEQFMISVELDDPLDLTLSASATQVCAYTDVQLQVSVDPPGNYTYNWSPSATLSAANIANPVASPGTSTMYQVVVSTITGCSVAVDSILVQVTDGNVLDQEAITQTNALCLGDSSQLEVVVHQIIAEDNFNLGQGTIWQTITNGTVNNLCGSVTGDALYFDGAGNRLAQTVGLDVTNGGIVRFSLKVANGTAPCADAAFGQNVLLEYSINGGGAWVLMNTYFEYQYPNFTSIDAVIPPAAQTANTMFRWSQPTNGGAGQSNWVLDDVAIGALETTGLTFTWQPAATLSDASSTTPMAYPDETGWYGVDIFDPATGCNYQDSIFITVGEPFSIDMPADTAICDIAGIQLYAIPSSGTNHTWNWSPATNLNSALIQDPIATPQQTTTYGVTVVTGQGCVATDSVTITVNQLLSLDITTTDDELCQGESTQLNSVVSGNTTNIVYSWTPNNTLSDPAIGNPTASPTQTTNYVLTATDTLTGCILTDSILIDVSTLYDLVVTNDTMICDVTGFQLNVLHNVPNGNVSWSPAAYVDDATSDSPTIIWPNTEQYIVVVSDALGCSATDTVDITIAFSNMVFYPDSSICAGDVMVIDAGFPGSTYAWSTGATSQTITVDEAGSYSVLMTDTEGCQTTFTTDVTVDPLPQVDLGPDQVLCIGESYTLNAGNNGISYLWNTGAQTATITLTTDNDVWVEVVDANYCVNSDSASIVFAPLPVISLADQIVCVSETITLDAGNPGSTYAWSTGETSQAIDVSAASGTYSVTVTTPELCSASDQAQLTFIDFPIVDLGPDTALCDTDSITLNAGNPAASHIWSTGSTDQSITLTTSHVAWVEVDNGYCTTVDTAVVIFNPLPDLLLNDTIVCISETIVLDAGNSGSNYLWSTGATSQTIAVSETSGTYSVQITTAENCTDSDQATLEFIVFPEFELGPDTALCDTESISFDLGNPGSSYLWSTGSSLPTATLTSSAVLWGQVDNGYCITRDSVSVIFNPLPHEIVKYQSVCLDHPPNRVMMDAENPGCSYSWITGDTTQQLWVSGYGWYQVVITTPENCSIEERIEIEEYCPPAVYLPNTFTPDGDGINEIFGPSGNNLAKLELLIFNRWGELIHSGVGENAFWNGHTASGPAQDGVYVWKLKYRFFLDTNGTMGEDREETGHVTLLR